MPIRTLISALLITSTAAAQAGLSVDRDAHNACMNRFESISRSENLALKAEQTYQSPLRQNHNFHYFFNASSRGDAAKPKHYRVECRALRSGKVIEFALDQGRWNFQLPQTRGLASR